LLEKGETAGKPRIRRSNKLSIHITRNVTPSPKLPRLEHKAGRRGANGSNGTTAVLYLYGALDGTTYESLVEAASTLIEEGARRIIIDLENVDALSIAGQVGLFTVGMLLEGRPVAGLDGYAVIGEMRKAIDDGLPFANLYLASPSGQVGEFLHANSLDQLARVQPSVDDAMAVLLNE
jgi:hypothetical protein